MTCSSINRRRSTAYIPLAYVPLWGMVAWKNAACKEATSNMGWANDRWEAFREGLGQKRYTIPIFIKTVLFVAAAVFLYFIGYKMSMSNQILFGIVVLLAILFWVMLEYAVKLRKQIRGTRVGLSELREKGVELRNEGREVMATQAAWDDWRKRAEKWNADVIQKIGEISQADAIWFSILDVVPNPRIPIGKNNLQETIERRPWIKEHERLYHMHDFRVARLGEMIRELWRD